MKISFFSIILAVLIGCPPAKENYLLVGTYDSPNSQGIFVYTFDSETGNFKKVSNVLASNPSFLAVSKDEKFVYAAAENANKGNGGEVGAYRFDKSSGTLAFINRVLSAGDHPCHLTIDQTGKWLFVSNYTSGTLSVIPIKEDGSLAGATTVIQHKGSGVNASRQESPHVHSTEISPDNKWLFVQDLGIDKIMIYGFDESTGKLLPAPTPFVATTPGSGPRHFTFHPNKQFAYVVEELTGSIEAYKYNAGTLTQIQSISTLPANDTVFAGSADIHISNNGKFLYASNRGGSNTIAIYSIDASSGKLSLLAHQSTLGTAPRNFSLDPSGKFLLVANQGTDEIVIFNRDEKTGLLKDNGSRIKVGKPVCLKWTALK